MTLSVLAEPHVTLERKRSAAAGLGEDDRVATKREGARNCACYEMECGERQSLGFFYWREGGHKGVDNHYSLEMAVVQVHRKGNECLWRRQELNRRE